MSQQEIFQASYNNLNEQQKLAVDTIEGPVMVIAGPGTGKTQILTARIGRILLDTDSRPENILCLTYTDAGVVAMRKRLLSFIGSDAYKVNIYTFHAFCNDIIQQNLSLFEKTSLDPISELERVELLKQLIDTFPKNHPLKRYRGDVYYEVGNLKSLFSTMKREGWTPELIASKIDEYISLVEQSEPGTAYYDQFKYKRNFRDKRPGDLKPAFDEIKETMERLKAAAREFNHFQQMMRSRERYDFDDMINWVIRAFEDNELLLRRYQEQYLYILVDEYQDTSGTQNRLVELLINYWDKPNVFVVGDDDQSIYRFQGASLENMEAFAKSYVKDLLKVVLTTNYRSTQPILDISKTLIEHNQERLVTHMPGLSKNLVAIPGLAALTSLPRIQECETERQEMTAITLEVEKLIHEGVPAGRIGVIYKENRYGEELGQYLKLRKIPAFSKRSFNILLLPLTKKIILVLRYLWSEHDIPYSGDELLFEILHMDWFSIPPIEIAKLTTEVADRRYQQNKISLRALLVEKSQAPPKDLFSPSLHAGLGRASAILERLIGEVPNVTLQHLVEQIIREAGVLNRIMADPDKIWLLQVLTAFFDFIKDETGRNPALGLRQLMPMIDLMEKEKLPLPLAQVSGSEKGVNLLTAHGSKGLEFDYVFFVGCNASFWEKKVKNRTGYWFPDTLFTSAPKQHEEEELRRLFYVALTRARQHLLISYSRFKNDGRELEPSMFLAEILDTHALVVERPVIPAEVQAEFLHLHLAREQAPEIQTSETEFVERLLSTFVMNVTALNHYLNCPLEFYFKNLIRIPSPKNESTEFGSAVHYALEQLFRTMQANQQEFAPLETFISWFDWFMERHRESFTQEQFNRRIEYGHTVLTNYYHKYLNEWNRIVAVELFISHVVVEGVPLKGKLDKLEFTGKAVNVVDYKTGDPDKARQKLQGPSSKDPIGGDYWRQAVFYKILLDHYGKRDWQALSSEFDFIEPDKKKNYRKQKLFITPEDIAEVTRQIKDSWDKIHRHEFYVGCGKADCHWCNFVKTNNLAVALHEVHEEEPTEEGF